MGVRYVPDHVGFGRMMVDRKIGNHMERVALSVIPALQAISPVDSKPDGEHYINMFRVDGGIRPVFTVSAPPELRAVAILRNISGHAAAVEFGQQGKAKGKPDKGKHILKKAISLIERGN